MLRIQLRRGTATQWTTANPVLAQGEMGTETDTGRFKIGDGSTAWTALNYGSDTELESTLEHNSGTNLLLDGQYKRDATWWAAELFTGKTLSTTQAFNGTQSLKITGNHSHHPNVTAPGQAGDDTTYAVIASEGGRVYRYSCRMYRPSTNTSTGYFRSWIGAMGAAGSDLVGGYGPEDVLNQTDMPTNTWFEYTNWFWVPYTGTHAPYSGVFPQIATASVDAADVLYIDDERFEDMTNSPPQLVAPPPTGDRTTDTKNVQRLVNLAQAFRGTVVLREGTYAVDIVTARTYRQPRIVGQGKQLTFIDGTIKMCGQQTTSDDNFTGGWLEGFSWTGSHPSSAALELNGVTGVHGKEIYARGTYANGILFHNELSNAYTETCSFVMDIAASVVEAVAYKVTSGQASFHGCGLELGSNIQCNNTNAAIKINTNARPYNAPMSVRFWTTTDTVPVFQHSGEVQSNFLGNLCVEAIGSGVAPQGTGMWLASGWPVFFGGSLNTYLGSGALDYGTFRLMSNVAAQGGALTPAVAVGPNSVSRLLDGNGRTLVDFGVHANAVNFVEIDNAATGVAPVIYAWGSDTNVDLFLATKGTGQVYANNVPVVTTTGTQTVTGKTVNLTSNTVTGTTAQFNTALSDNDFATLAGTETLTGKSLTGPKINQIVDANGHLVFDLPAAASAVNYFEFDNSATGIAPTIYAWGSDSNIHLNLSTKGTGVVKANDVPVATTTDAQTLTNKRITARVNVINAPGATPALAWDSYDQINLTGINAAITSLSSGITGTPTAGQRGILRFKDDGTGRAITPGASWRAIGVTLSTTTVANKTLYWFWVYNSTDSKYDVYDVKQEA